MKLTNHSNHSGPGVHSPFIVGNPFINVILDVAGGWKRRRHIDRYLEQNSHQSRKVHV